MALSSNLPPGVTDRDIEGQIGEELEVEGRCPNGHLSSSHYNAVKETRQFLSLKQDSYDQPLLDLDGQPIWVAGFAVTCEEPMSGNPTGDFLDGDVRCGADFWVVGTWADQLQDELDMLDEVLLDLDLEGSGDDVAVDYGHMTAGEAQRRAQDRLAVRRDTQRRQDYLRDQLHADWIAGARILRAVRSA